MQVYRAGVGGGIVGVLKFRLLALSSRLQTPNLGFTILHFSWSSQAYGLGAFSRVYFHVEHVPRSANDFMPGDGGPLGRCEGISIQLPVYDTCAQSKHSCSPMTVTCFQRLYSNQVGAREDCKGLTT